MQSIKIAGISGVGKSTLMHAVAAKARDVRTHCYSDYLRKFGREADMVAARDLASFGGTSLMDEHLEIGTCDLTDTYVRENTRGIVLLDVDVPTLLQRRQHDLERTRDGDLEIAQRQQRFSIERAYRLASRCQVPLLHLRNADLVRSSEALDNFIRRAG